MEVKIGIQNVQRELILEANVAAQDIQRALSAAMAEGTVLVLEDEKGGKYLVPADKIAYIELGGSEPRRVGFGS